MNNKGFGLLSVLIAIVLLAIGAVAITSLSIQSTHMIAKSTHRVQADAVASLVMEQMLAQDTIAESFVRYQEPFIVHGKVEMADSVNILRIDVSYPGLGGEITRISRPTTKEIRID